VDKEGSSLPQWFHGQGRGFPNVIVLNGFKLSKGNERPHRVNSQIRISPVVLINHEGRNMGSMPTQKAMEIASMVGLDLVETR